MTNAPERIWIEDEFGEGDDDQWTYGTWDVRNYAGYNVEYVRADIVQALTAERDRLREDLEELDFLRHEGGPDSVAAIEAERDRLREALTRLLAPFGNDACHYDHHGYCQEHFIEADCCVAHARAALKGETP